MFCPKSQCSFRLTENLWLKLLLFLFPLCYMVIQHWSNVFALLLFLTAVYGCFRTRKTLFRDFTPSCYWICIALASPFVGTLLAGLLRGSWMFRELDSPSRFLLAIPVFLYIREKRLDVASIFEYALPLTLLINILAVTVFHLTYHEYAPRFGTSASDPLIFGDTSLILGFMLLAVVAPQGAEPFYRRALKYGAYAMGLFLSLGSQSRSGWCAFPFLLLAYVILNWGDASKKRVALFFLLHLVFIAILFYLVPSLHARLLNWVYETSSYVNQTNLDTSEGLRLVIWKIALVLFQAHPWLGYGDSHNFYPFLTQSNITSFASPAAIDTLHCCGPHNELLGNMLYTGVFGIIRVVLLFCVPFYIFVRYCQRALPISAAARMGLMYVLGLACTSVTIEVFTLKYSATFYAVMIAALVGSVLVKTRDA